jgi:HlyD family secretion protein
MKKKIIIGLIVLVAFAIAGYVILKKEPSKEIKWDTKPITRGSISNTITATGTLQAVTTIQVGTQVSGIISKLYIDYNSKVKKGQILAMIDTTTLSASVFDARAAVYRQQIQVNQTKRDYERTKDLFAQKVVAQTDYDLALDNYETAKSSLISAQAQLNRAMINLGYATILAPLSGVVISKSVEQGQTVAASLNSPTLFTIVDDLTKMQVQASIDEADIGQVKEGEKVTFTVDAYPEDKFNGSVKQIRIDPVIVSNVVNYVVIVDVPNPDLKLMPGMTANITVTVNEATDVMKVPVKALSFRPPNFYLYELMAGLPDSTKKRINDRIESMKERMRSAGTSETDINTRIDAMRISLAFGGSPTRSTGAGGGGGFGGPGGGGGGFGGGGQTAAPARPRVSTSCQIWIKEGDNLKVVRVRTTLKDGTFASVESPELKDSMTVVVGAVYDKNLDKVAAAATNPLMPQARRGGGFR